MNDLNPTAGLRELAREPRTVIRSAIRRSLPGLDDVEIDEVLIAAAATKGRALRELADHLFAHPDALLLQKTDGPLALIRVLDRLANRGHPVARPSCAGCGKHTAQLARSGPSGRICSACAAKITKHNCERCGRTQVRIMARRADGRICNFCYLTDPERIEPCARCTRPQNPVARLDDGRPVCKNCWDRPHQHCSLCGRDEPAPYAGTNGSLCARCYHRHQQRRAPCGRCGEIRIVARRARDNDPDLCGRCNRPHEICCRCGRDRPGRRNDDGTWLCTNCTARPRQTCARCQRPRPVSARLPLGPVCNPCHCALHDNPALCAGCREPHVLIGHDERGPICGPCAGSLLDPRCRACGQPGRHYTGKKCARCVLADRLDQLLAGPDRTPHPQLAPARDLLLATDRPRGLLHWLAHGATPQLLQQLARTGEPITHGHLDALPQGRHELFLRRLLVHAEVLPARNDDLERIPAWLDTLLADQPEHRTRLIRPFAHWFVLHRARRSAARRRHPAHAERDVRSRIRAALEFLTWLEALNLNLASTSQAVLDQWLVEGNARAYDVRYFLSWARSHRLAQDLRVPIRSWTQPEHMLDETTRWQLLERSLHDTTHPLDTRVAAALILLFGLPATRIRHLTVDHLQQQNDQTSLRTGTHQLLLPPKLAELIGQLATGEHGRSRYQRTGSTPQWLFPGLTPGAPLTTTGLGLKLKAFGMHARPARNAALAALAADLPSPVLADLLGLHPVTAAHWAKLVARDWNAYVAARPPNTATIE